jgi:hypothetical protein
VKDIELAKRWRRTVSETVVEEYPAGSKATVTAEVAKEAVAAGVLKGEPVDTPPAEAPTELKKKA